MARARLSVLTAMHVLRSLAFYVAFYLGSVFYVLAAVAVIPLVPRLVVPVADGWSRYHRTCLRVIAGLDVQISGVMPAGEVLFAIKHESMFEAIDLPTLLTRPIGFAKQELFRIPGWGRAARAYGIIPVARDEGSKAVRDIVSEAQRLAGSGRPLAIFPEGTRVARGSRPALKSGFTALYKVLKIPVVPVAVDSGLLYRRRWKKPGTIRVHFGEAIPPGLPRAEVERRVYDGINALND